MTAEATRLKQANRCKSVQNHMALVLNVLSGPNWDQVKYGRWSNRQTGHHIETNYVYGEGTIRIYSDPASSKPTNTIKIRGVFGELNAVWSCLSSPALRDN